MIWFLVAFCCIDLCWVNWWIMKHEKEEKKSKKEELDALARKAQQEEEA